MFHMKPTATTVLLGMALTLLLSQYAIASDLKIGWSMADLTPDGPVEIRGGVQSEGVMDPITATALVLESGSGSRAERIVLVSCDLLWIPDGNRNTVNFRDHVRGRLRDSIPEISSEKIILMATHTHMAPAIKENLSYGDFAAERIAAAVVKAWEGRKPGGIGYGLGQAVLSHNRIVTHRDGSSRMVGSFQKGTAAHPEFSHIEGFEDHSVHLLFTVDKAGQITGLVINTPCPAQVQRGNLLSADYWHEARHELRQRFGDELFILPQVSSAGDLATTVMVEKRGEDRMQRLQFPALEEPRDRRRSQLAVRLADAVSAVLPVVHEHVDYSPPIAHRTRVLDLPLGFPQPKPDGGILPAELHVLRLGDVGMATNPFELYVDYGVRIKGRSPAVQTFIVELAGSGSYLPTERAIAGEAYGAIPRTSIVGSSAGDTLVETTLEMLDELWQSDASESQSADRPTKQGSP
jgi:hypothetical protein